MIHVKGHNFLTRYVLRIYFPLVGSGGDVAETSLILRQDAAPLGGRSPAFPDVFKFFLDISSLEDATTVFYGNVRNRLRTDAASYPKRTETWIIILSKI